MPFNRGSVAAGALAAVLGATATFVLTTTLMDTLPDAVLVAASSLAAFAVAAALGGARALAANRRQIGLAALGGALAFFAAPMLALSQRASDAPSGSESLFFTTSLWGVLLVAISYAVVADRPRFTSVAGSLLAAAGSAGLLASWEYPSSFSPFAKFPVREALMLLAGLAFAAGALLLVRVARRIGSSASAAAALGGAAAIAVVAVLPSLAALGAASPRSLVPTLYLGIAVAVFAIGWVGTLASVGAARASATMLAVPLAVMALAGVEHATAVYGPSPVAWPAATGGMVATAFGVLVVWMGTPVGPRDERARVRLGGITLGVAGTALALALVAMATGALNAVAEGHIGEPFSATWTMLGYESAAGWIVLAAASLVLATALEARRGAAIMERAVAAAAAVVGVVSAIPLLGTTLHTWNRWVPAEVQQTYGTEYARLTVTAHIEPVRVAAAVLILIAAVLLTIGMIRTSGPTQPEEASA